MAKGNGEHPMDEDRQRFAELVASGMTASEAMRQVRPHLADGSARSQACRWMTDDRVVAYIDRIQAKAAERHSVTLDSLAEELNEAWDMAKTLAQPSAMIAATTAKAKLFGFMSDRLKTENVTYVISADPGMVDQSGDAAEMSWQKQHFGGDG